MRQPAATIGFLAVFAVWHPFAGVGEEGGKTTGAPFRLIGQPDGAGAVRVLVLGPDAEPPSIRWRPTADIRALASPDMPDSLHLKFEIPLADRTRVRARIGELAPDRPVEWIDPADVKAEARLIDSETERVVKSLTRTIGGHFGEFVFNEAGLQFDFELKAADFPGGPEDGASMLDRIRTPGAATGLEIELAVLLDGRGTGSTIEYRLEVAKLAERLAEEPLPLDRGTLTAALWDSGALTCSPKREELSADDLAGLAAAVIEKMSGMSLLARTGDGDGETFKPRAGLAQISLTLQGACQSATREVIRIPLDALEAAADDGSGASAARFAYGPFGGEAILARDALRGEPTYHVPGRMRVATAASGCEFALAKFLLVETHDPNVAGFEKGYVAMGGLVDFSIEPVDAPAPRAAILWRGLEAGLPSFETEPQYLADGPEAGGAWMVNLHLRRHLFDPLWQDARKDTDAAAPRHRHRLVPKMRATLVYRDHVRIDASDRRTCAITADSFRAAFDALSRDAGGAWDVTDGEPDRLALMRGIVGRGALDGVDAGGRDAVADALLLGLFGLVRPRWLTYELRPGTGGKGTRLVLALREEGLASTQRIEYAPVEWAPVERHRTIPVEVASGVCETREILAHGYHRQTGLHLRFLPWSRDWADSGIEKVRMSYQMFRGGSLFQTGALDVPIPRDHSASEGEAVDLASFDGEEVAFRFKPAGYWKGGRFLPVLHGRWFDAPASMRNHFHFILPEHLEPEDPQ